MDDVAFQSPPNAPFVVMAGQLQDGQPVKVLLDTGAAAPFEVIVAPKAAAAAGLRASGSAETARGVSGAVAAAVPTQVKRFRLGPVALDNPQAVVLPALEQVSAKVGQEIDVLVGAKFLKDRVVSIDYERRRVDLTADTPRATPQPFEFGAKRQVVLVRATVNGAGPFLLALDTGASHTLLSTAASQRAGLKPAGSIAITGAGGTLPVSMAQGRVTFGPHERTVALLVSDAVGQIGEAAGAPLDGVMGADVFGYGKLTLDYPGRRLWMQAPSATP
jgi:predicted aspartyl protease